MIGRCNNRLLLLSYNATLVYRWRLIPSWGPLGSFRGRPVDAGIRLDWAVADRLLQTHLILGTKVVEEYGQQNQSVSDSQCHQTQKGDKDGREDLARTKRQWQRSQEAGDTTHEDG